MAIDPEEFKKRREKRAAQRKKRKRTARKLLIAVAALLVLAAVIVLLSMNGGTQPPREDPAQTSEDMTGKTVIRLAAAGDLNVTPKLIESGGTELDYTKTFMDVLPLLSEADVTLLNLEGNFYGQPYGTDRSAPQSLANAISRAGVDLVQLANSYSIYKGMDGLKKTIDAVRAEGMEPLGVYPTATDASMGKGYTIRTVQGVKIAFVAFTKGMDGMALPAGNEGCVNVLYEDYSTDYRKVDTAGITRVLTAAEKEKPDLTVVLLHWGSEFNNTISETQQSILTLLLENGVDAVIGTHSHYVQEMHLDPETGTFVAYSLGDFAGDAARAGSEYSVVLELEITKDEKSGETAITGFDYTPIFTVVEEGKPVRVVRIKEAMEAFDGDYIDKVSQETYEDMAYALQRIEARIKGE